MPETLRDKIQRVLDAECPSERELRATSTTLYAHRLYVYCTPGELERVNHELSRCVALANPLYGGE